MPVQGMRLVFYDDASDILLLKNPAVPETFQAYQMVRFMESHNSFTYVVHIPTGAKLLEF